MLRPPILVQMIKQIAGLVAIAFRYDNKVPGPDDGPSRNVYALPFSGAWTVLNGGVAEETSHSWEVVTQRYAYDFLVLDDEGFSRAGGAGDPAGAAGAASAADPSDPTSYLCYGLDVLAPAAGTVVEVRDDCPDAPIAFDGAVACGGDDIRGNHVLIEHAHDEYSSLCHLMPGSVAVRVGDEVACGQAVGRCGNSGNSSEPHLHFHVQAGRSFYSSLGVPVRFEGLVAEPAPRYDAIDPRPIPADAYEAFPPFLTRGLRVRPAPADGEAAR